MIGNTHALAVTLLVCALALAVIAPAGAVAATDDYPEESTLAVDLEEDGSAAITLTTVYNLEADDEREAFRSLEDDEETQAELLERFADRMADVANESGHGADTVSAEGVVVDSADDRGIVAVTVSWNGLATVDDDQLVLTEPFASGFDSDQRLVIDGPTETSVASSTPDPASIDESTVTFESNTSLEGFELVYDREGDTDGAEDASDDDDTAADDTSDGDGTTADTSDDAADADGAPGFGLALGLVAIASLVGAAVRRRRMRG